MDWITNNLDTIIAIATATVTLASLLANLTKNETDNVIVGYASKVVNFLALNWKKPTPPSA